MYVFNIQERLSAAFGIQSDRYNGQLDSQGASRRIPATPFVDNIQFLAGGSVIYEFPFEPLVEFSREKRIVETEIVYQDELTGTVSEIVSGGNASVTIRGLLIDPDRESLMDRVDELMGLFDRDESLEVSSRFLNAVGVENLILKRVSTPSLEGFPDTIPFVIEARSDTPLELVINT